MNSDLDIKIAGDKPSEDVKRNRAVINKEDGPSKEEIEKISVEDITDEYIDLITIINERKQKEKEMKLVLPYSRLVFDKNIFDKSCNVSKAEILSSPNTLTGIPTSSGTTEGEVIIIDDPKETIDTTNKIIVTVSTDPGWVFLIKNAKGIVAERGSLLSHTAIVSRELNKPAIVNVKDCTTILKNGDFIRINADSGKIEIIKRGNSNATL